MRGTHVVLGPHDDALAARYGGWGNLVEATGHGGTADGRRAPQCGPLAAMGDR